MRARIMRSTRVDDITYLGTPSSNTDAAVLEDATALQSLRVFAAQASYGLREEVLAHRQRGCEADSRKHRMQRRRGRVGDLHRERASQWAAKLEKLTPHASEMVNDGQLEHELRKHSDGVAQLADELHGLFAQLGAKTSLARFGQHCHRSLLAGIGQTIELPLAAHSPSQSTAQHSGKHTTFQIECDLDEVHHPPSSIAKQQWYFIGVGVSAQAAVSGPFLAHGDRRNSYNLRCNTDSDSIFVHLLSPSPLHIDLVVKSCQTGQVGSVPGGMTHESDHGRTMGSVASSSSEGEDDDESGYLRRYRHRRGIGTTRTKRVEKQLSTKLRQQRRVLCMARVDGRLGGEVGSGGAGDVGRRVSSVCTNPNSPARGRHRAVAEGRSPQELVKFCLMLWLGPCNNYFTAFRRAQGSWVRKLSPDCPRRLVKFLRKLEQDQHALSIVVTCSVFAVLLRRQRELCFRRGREALKTLIWLQTLAKASRIVCFARMLDSKVESHRLLVRSTSSSASPRSRSRVWDVGASPRSPFSQARDGGSFLSTGDVPSQVDSRISHERPLIARIVVGPSFSRSSGSMSARGSERALAYSPLQLSGGSTSTRSPRMGHIVPLRASRASTSQTNPRRMLRIISRRCAATEGLVKLEDDGAAEVSSPISPVYQGSRVSAHGLLGHIQSVSPHPTQSRNASSLSHRPLRSNTVGIDAFEEAAALEVPWFELVRMMMVAIQGDAAFLTRAERQCLDVRLKSLPDNPRGPSKLRSDFVGHAADFSSELGTSLILALSAYVPLVDLSDGALKQDFSRKGTNASFSDSLHCVGEAPSGVGSRPGELPRAPPVAADGATAWKASLFASAKECCHSANRDCSGATLYSQKAEGGAEKQRLRKLAEIAGPFVVDTHNVSRLPQFVSPSIYDGSNLISTRTAAGVRMRDFGEDIYGFSSSKQLNVHRCQERAKEIPHDSQPRVVRLEALRLRTQARDLQRPRERPMQGCFGRLAQNGDAEGQKRYKMWMMRTEVPPSVRQAKESMESFFAELTRKCDVGATSNTISSSGGPPLMTSMSDSAELAGVSAGLSIGGGLLSGAGDKANLQRSFSPQCNPASGGDSMHLRPPQTAEEVGQLVLQSDALQTILGLERESAGETRYPGFRSGPMTEVEIRRAWMLEQGAKSKPRPSVARKRT